MTVAYVEASALVKLALVEDHSADLRDALRGTVLVTSELSVLEVGRALLRSDGDAGLARARAELLRFDTLPVDRGVLDQATRLEPAVLRSLDAIHVASALALGAPDTVFFSYDARTREVARSNGLVTASPGAD